MNNNDINNNQIIIDEDKNIENEDYLFSECELCYEKIENKELNKIQCGYLFCIHCWFNYLKILITEAKVEKIKCMNHGCDENILEDFILKHIFNNNGLIEKYKKFKKRIEKLQDKNKKLYLNINYDNFFQKSNKSKYVKCEYGHYNSGNCQGQQFEKADYPIIITINVNNNINNNRKMYEIKNLLSLKNYLILKQEDEETNKININISPIKPVIFTVKLIKELYSKGRISTLLILIHLIKEELFIINDLNTEIKIDDLLSKYLIDTYLKGKINSFYKIYLASSNVPLVLEYLNNIFDKNEKENKLENSEIEHKHKIVLNNTSNNNDKKSIKKINASIPMKFSNKRFDSKLSLNKIIGIYHMIFFLLFLKLFSFSWQAIPAVFFCDDQVRDIYKVENNNQIPIARGYVGNWETSHPFPSLNAAPDDLIKYTCYNDVGQSFGAGCFVVNSRCYCYNFEVYRARNTFNSGVRTYNFGSIECSIPIYYLVEYNNHYTYIYQHQIPLNASDISCQKQGYILFVQYGENLVLNLSSI